MDTLTSLVLLRCMAANSTKANVSVGLAGCHKEGNDKLLSPLVLEIHQISSVPSVGLEKLRVLKRPL
jgi:hypothetical protein